MKVMLTVCFCMLLVFLWVPSWAAGSVDESPCDTGVPADTAAEEIVAAYIEAIGGLDAVKAVDYKRITYRIHMIGRESYLMERTWTRPNTMKTGRPGAATYTLTEGERSWRVSSGERQELPSHVARSMSRQADIEGPLVDPVEKGVTLVYSGVVRYDLAELVRIIATFPGGSQWEFFFDTNTGLLRKETRPSFVMRNGRISRGADVTLLYYDYRPVEGILVPHLWIQSADSHTHLFVVEDIETRK
jgi:hypothetical protein